jgi:putative transposase
MNDPSKQPDPVPEGTLTYSVQRTIVLKTRTGDHLRVCNALTHQTKNLYNTGLYAIRQVMTAYDRDTETGIYTLRGDLHEEQRTVLEHLNRVITRINQDRVDDHPRKVSKARTKFESDPKNEGRVFDPPKPKILLLLGERMETNPVFPVVDDTVLDNYLKTRPDETGQIVYRRLPAAMAQQARYRLQETIKGYWSVLKRYNADPTGMTGRPAMPGYLDRNDRFVAEIPFVTIRQGLPALSERDIPDWELEGSFLDRDMLEAFDGVDIRAEVARVLKAREMVNATPQHLRIVPLRRGVRWEVVVRIEKTIPADSFMGRLLTDHREVLDGKKDKQRREWIENRLRGLPKDRLPRIAGIDLGLTNIATVAYSTGDRAMVHSGWRFVSVVEKKTNQIGDLVSTITPVRVKTLQAKKESLKAENQRLPKAEAMEIRKELAAIYRDDRYRSLMEKKGRWTQDYLHKLSTRIVEDCVDRKIDVLVIGRNKGWKQEVEMGTEQNRRFCAMAHTTLIRLLTYKAEALGMVVLTTEESYTSKSSFANGDLLQTHEKETAQQATVGGEAQGGMSVKPVIVLTGHRSDDRKWFISHDRNDRWRKIHADLNGAYNIVRKVFTGFGFERRLSSRYDKYWLSPRRGVVLVPSCEAA